MSQQVSQFPVKVWDGTAKTLKSTSDDRIDFQISDQHSAEIQAVEAYLKAYVDLLRLYGTPNTILGVNHLGTGLEYKQLVAGSNVTISHSAGAITFSAVGGGGSGDVPYTGEADVDINIGQPVYVKVNTHIDLAKADSAATMFVAGLVSASASATFSGSYLSDGRIIQADWTAIIGTASLTPGAVYYLDNVTAGMLTAVAPTTGFVISVGQAKNTTTLDIEISEPIKL